MIKKIVFDECWQQFLSPDEKIQINRDLVSNGNNVNGKNIDGDSNMIQGPLRLQNNKRYAIHHNIDLYYELTSGDIVEVFKDGQWVRTSIESSKGEYYLTDGTPINGALVRTIDN